MNWRTDKPTADIIVALISDGGGYDVLYRRDDGKYVNRYDEPSYSIIEKWADLEEDEVTNCSQKQRGRPRKVYEYPVDVPNNDGFLEFKYMTNATIRKKLLLKKGERAIISIRREQ